MQKFCLMFCASYIRSYVGIIDNWVGTADTAFAYFNFSLKTLTGGMLNFFEDTTYMNEWRKRLNNIWQENRSLSAMQFYVLKQCLTK